MGSRHGNFTALSRSESLELAYRPTRSADVVLRVFTRAHAPVFLRTQTFDTWTGKTWTESNQPGREATLRIGLWDARPFGVDRVKQQFELNTRQPEATARGLVRTVVQAQTKLNGVVPVPTEALGAIWMLDGADQSNQFLSSTMFWRTDGTASTQRERGASTTYTVLHDTRTSGIIDDIVSTQNGENAEWLSTKNVSPAVRQLAKQIVGSASTSSEKVQKIRQWMTTNVAYNLTAKDPGRTIDPIDYLLFTSREGSCTHFATATAALLRSVGVPTRISTGFVAQEQPRIFQFVVRGRDAHAWAEVPLVDGDWLQVDTTIGAREVFPAPTNNRARFALIALLTLGAALLVAGVWMIKGTIQRRSAPKSSLFTAKLVRLARRVGIRTPLDCSTAKLANLVDERLASTKSNTGHSAWSVGTLRSFGQQLEAATFGAAPVDLSAGQQIFKVAFRRARSQRWEQRRLRLAYLVRVKSRNRL
jgi:transglutaminase-like putative cysteine protease